MAAYKSDDLGSEFDFDGTNEPEDRRFGTLEILLDLVEKISLCVGIMK